MAKVAHQMHWAQPLKCIYHILVDIGLEIAKAQNNAKKFKNFEENLLYLYNNKNIDNMKKFRDFDRTDEVLKRLIATGEKALADGIESGKYIPPYECNTILHSSLSEDYNRMTAYIAHLRSELQLPIAPKA